MSVIKAKMLDKHAFGMIIYLNQVCIDLFDLSAVQTHLMPKSRNKAKYLCHCIFFH